MCRIFCCNVYELQNDACPSQELILIRVWGISNSLFLIVVGLIEIGVLIYFFIEKMKAKDKWYCFSLALMIGGAVGNLYDRWVLGYVRDFIDTYPLGYNFPVFNIADAALCIGVGIILILMLLEERNEKKNV